MPFNPKVYTLDAKETYEKKLDFDKFLAENQHLAMPFPVEGLREFIPPQLPGFAAVIGARSHHAKSIFTKFAVHQAQLAIEEKTDQLVAYATQEDTPEMTAMQQIKRYESSGGNAALRYQDDYFIVIGRSFGMSADEVGDLTMKNIVSCLEYGRSGKFALPKQYAFIAEDYLQLTPADPDRPKYDDNKKRQQISDDVSTFINALLYFKCAGWLVSQCLMKEQRAGYSAKMKIPGDADLAESGEIFSKPPIVYTLWLPKRDYPENTIIEEGNWKFRVTDNLCFLRVAKYRYAEDLGYFDCVGRVFPMLIERDGTFTYTQELHQSFLVNPKAI